MAQQPPAKCHFRVKIS